MIFKLLRRISPWLVSDASALSLGEKGRASLAACVAIFLVGWLSSEVLNSADMPVMVASMGASAVLLFGMPKSPLAQPWPLVGGNLIAAFLGVTCARFMADPWLASAVAVGATLFAMHFTHSLHPPGGAIALLAVLGGETVHAKGYGFMLVPVGLNLAMLLILALILNNILPGHSYPTGPRRKDARHHHDDPAPLARLGLDRDDLRQALRDIDTYLDVSEADLDRVFSQAGIHAFRRKMGQITCGDIMSRDLITVEYGTDLEEAWALLRYHKIKALPVVDPFRRVIGVVTLVDYLKRTELKSYATFKDKLTEFIRPTPGLYANKPEVVGQIMATPAFTITESRHIVELVPLLSDLGMHHIPVVDADKRLVGMITQSDLIAALYAGDVMKGAPT